MLPDTRACDKQQTNIESFLSLFLLLFLGCYYIEVVNRNHYVKKLPEYCDHGLRIISI